MADMAVKYTSEDIGKITLFEDLTRLRVIDSVISEDNICFVVNSKNIGSVIGKNGENIRNIQNKIGKRIKVYGYSDNVMEFARNLTSVPINNIKLIEKKGIKTIKITADRKMMPLIIGRKGNNIKIIKTFLKRQFDIRDVKLS